MMPVVPDSLRDIASDDRWVVWCWEDRMDKHGQVKPTKPPLRAINGKPSGYAHNNKPCTWASLEGALEASSKADGIGLQLLGLSGVAALDLDNVRTGDGSLLPWAKQIIEHAGSYAEFTPSGRGARIMGRVSEGHKSLHTKKEHPDGGEFEVYANLTEGSGRYITVTGDRIEGSPDALSDISVVIASLLDAAKNSNNQANARPLSKRASPVRASVPPALPEWVRAYLSGDGTGDRSADFQSIVNALRPRGWSFEDVLKLFEDHPDGPSGKFTGRLETELRRSWQKADPPRSEVAGARDATLKQCDDPVDLWGQFPPPALPRGLLPPLIEEFAFARGAQMGADPAGLAVAALVTCAAVIPARIKLQVKVHDNWCESARLWAALVGDPSTKNSPVLSAATGPLCKLDAEMFRDWQRAVGEYEELSKEDRASVPYPEQTRLRIEDTTIEAAQHVLAASPDGVMLLQDEMSGFFGQMDKYSGGRGASADRAFWLRTFNGGEYAFSRVGRGSGLIENLSVCLLGGIQPQPIRRVASDSHDDGLLLRLFPFVLRPASIGRDEPLPTEATLYGALIEQLRNLPSPSRMGGGVVRFHAAAQEVRRDLEAEHLHLQSMESVAPKLASHIGKYDGLFARLCLTWHCIEASGCEHLPETVSEDIARRVRDFLHGFLFRHAVAFYGGVLGLSDDHDRLKAIAGFILSRRLETVTNRDVQRGDRTMRAIRDQDIRPLLEQLASLGWLNRVDGPRPSSQPHWIVTPVVHTLFGDRAETERQRRAEVHAAINRTFTGERSAE